MLNKCSAVLLLLTSTGWLSASEEPWLSAPGLSVVGTGQVSDEELFGFHTEQNLPENNSAPAQHPVLLALAQPPVFAPAPPPRAPSTSSPASIPLCYCFTCKKSCGSNAAIHAGHDVKRVPPRFTVYECTECPGQPVVTYAAKRRDHSDHLCKRVFLQTAFEKWVADRDEKKPLAHAINRHSIPSHKHSDLLKKVPRA